MEKKEPCALSYNEEKNMNRHSRKHKSILFCSLKEVKQRKLNLHSTSANQPVKYLRLTLHLSSTFASILNVFLLRYNECIGYIRVQVYAINISTFVMLFACLEINVPIQVTTTG